MKLRKYLFSIFVAGLVLILTACGAGSKKQSKGMKIVTSFYPIYAMVKEVSGDLNDVRMIQSSTGIHSFEPSANDIAAIYDVSFFVSLSTTLLTSLLPVSASVELFTSDFTSTIAEIGATLTSPVTVSITSVPAFLSFIQIFQ